LYLEVLRLLFVLFFVSAFVANKHTYYGSMPVCETSARRMSVSMSNLYIIESFLL